MPSSTSSAEPVYSNAPAIYYQQPSAQQPDAPILNLQTNPSSPTTAGMVQQSGLLAADLLSPARLAQLDPEQYDLRESSHLVRFLRALLGDSGAGQLRKRYTLARLQATLEGSQFFDLDAFYGALFGALRTPQEQPPADPMTATFTPDDWDSIDVLDASYRSRIMGLAKSMPMAGTVEGLRMAAEALMDCPVDVYETWKMLESGITASQGHPWSQIAATYPRWKSFPQGSTWGSVTGAVTIGITGLSNADEVWVAPHKQYAPSPDAADPVRDVAVQQMVDANNLQRVLGRLKPAGVLLTVDPSGLAQDAQVPIAAIESDSDYWAVIAKTVPSPGMPPRQLAAYPPQVQSATAPKATPTPRLNVGPGTAWWYNGIVSSTSATLVDGDLDLNTGNGGQVVVDSEWQTVTAPDGRTGSFTPQLAIFDPATLAAAALSGDSAMQASYYSAPRTVTPTYG